MSVPRKDMRTECPNCSSIWGVGSGEWEWQQCDACGWPDNDSEPSDLDDDDDFTEDYESLKDEL